MDNNSKLKIVSTTFTCGSTCTINPAPTNIQAPFNVWAVSCREPEERLVSPATDTADDPIATDEERNKIIATFEMTIDDIAHHTKNEYKQITDHTSLYDILRILRNNNKARLRPYKNLQDFIKKITLFLKNMNYHSTHALTNMLINSHKTNFANDVNILDASDKYIQQLAQLPCIHNISRMQRDKGFPDPNKLYDFLQNPHFKNPDGSLNHDLIAIICTRRVAKGITNNSDLQKIIEDEKTKKRLNDFKRKATGHSMRKRKHQKTEVLGLGINYRGVNKLTSDNIPNDPDLRVIDKTVDNQDNFNCRSVSRNEPEKQLLSPATDTDDDHIATCEERNKIIATFKMTIDDIANHKNDEYQQITDHTSLYYILSILQKNNNKELRYYNNLKDFIKKITLFLKNMNYYSTNTLTKMILSNCNTCLANHVNILKTSDEYIQQLAQSPYIHHISTMQLGKGFPDPEELHTFLQNPHFNTLDNKLNRKLIASICGVFTERGVPTEYTVNNFFQNVNFKNPNGSLNYKLIFLVCTELCRKGIPNDGDLQKIIESKKIKERLKDSERKEKEHSRRMKKCQKTNNSVQS